MVIHLKYSSLYSHLVVSDSLRTHGLQHTRLPFPSPSPRACSNPCPLSQWCHPTISSSVVPFSSCSQSFPASGSFPKVCSLYQVAKALELQLQHQSSNEYSGLISFRIDWSDFLAVQGTKSLLQHHSSKALILWCSAFFIVQLLHNTWLLENYRNIVEYMDLCQQSDVSAF